MSRPRTDRVVVVTGAAGGIGTALVQRFLDNDDTVIATDLVQDGLDRLADRHHGRRLHSCMADVSRADDCATVADLARDRAGRVDVLLNVAGFFPIVDVEEMTVDQWRQVIDINLTGPFLVIRSVLPLMRDQGWGRIVNFSSASIFDGFAQQVHYTAAKAGVIGMTRSLALALGKYGITVNAVAPGLTLTPPIRDGFPAERVSRQRGMRAIQRDETADDLVGPTFFLASPDADFMSGQTVSVDGGRHKL